MYVKINCKLQTLGHIFEIRTWQEQKLRQSEKNLGFWQPFFFGLSGSESHETKKGQFQRKRQEKEQKNGRHEEKKTWTL